MADADKWTYADYVLFLEISTSIRVEVGILRRILRSLPLACMRFFWPEVQEGFDNLINLSNCLRERLDRIKEVEGPSLPGGESHADKAARKGQAAGTDPPAMSDGETGLGSILEAGRQQLERDDAIARSVEAVEAGDLAAGITIPTGNGQGGQEGPSEAAGSMTEAEAADDAMKTAGGETDEPERPVRHPDDISPEQRVVLANAARELERQNNPDGMLPSERAMAESRRLGMVKDEDIEKTAAESIVDSGWPMREPGTKKKGRCKK